MCNCRKRGGGGAAPAGGGGCVGPGCGVVRVAPVPLIRATRSAIIVTIPAPTPLIQATRSGPFVAMPAPEPTPQPTPLAGQTPTEEELPTVDTEIWGPHMWRFLHIASQGAIAAISRKGAWDGLLAAMATGLPCPDCRAHYGTWLTTYPLGYVFPDTVMPTKLYSITQSWVLALHNAVNVRRELPEWTAEQVAATEAYRGGRAAAREALAAAAAAGVAPWVIQAGEVVIVRAMA